MTPRFLMVAAIGIATTSLPAQAAREYNGTWGPFQSITDVRINGLQNANVRLRKGKGCAAIQFVVQGTLKTGMSGTKSLSAKGPGFATFPQLLADYNAGALPAGVTGRLEWTFEMECLRPSCTIVWCTNNSTFRFVPDPGAGPAVDVSAGNIRSRGTASLGTGPTDVGFLDDRGDRLSYREQNPDGTWPPNFPLNLEFDVECKVPHKPVVELDLDPESATGNNGQLGVSVTPLELHLSARGISASPPHEVYVFDHAGTLQTSYLQDPAMSASAWGWRDGANDDNWSDTTMFWGCEFGIFLADERGNPKTTYMAANGIQTLASNVISGPGLALVGNYRGVAYDPNGDGGNGSWWTGNFGSDLYEIDSLGNVLTQHPHNGIWSIYGLYRDPLTGFLWANSSPNVGDLAEIDPASGLETGRRRSMPDGIQGGLDGIEMGGIQGRSTGGNDLVALRQDTPDRLTAVRLNLSDVFDHHSEARLLGGVNGQLEDTPNVIVDYADTTIDLLLDDPNASTINSALFLTYGPNALDQVRLSQGFPFLLGFGFDHLAWSLYVPLLATNFVVTPMTPGVPLTIDVTPIYSLGGVAIGAQAVAVTTAIPGPTLPIYASNWVSIEY